jgi:hypothetical protein
LRGCPEGSSHRVQWPKRQFPQSSVEGLDDQRRLVLHVGLPTAAKAFIAGGLPRGGGIVKLQPHERQR